MGGIDWQAAMSLDFKNMAHDTNVLMAGVLIMLHGFVAEALRRRNATDLNA